jgi:hypothetical protein
VKILPVTLFIELFAAFRKSPRTLKMVPEATCSPDNSTENRLHPMRGGHCRRSLMTDKECTDNKENHIFLIYKGNYEWSSCKVIYD